MHRNQLRVELEAAEKFVHKSAKDLKNFAMELEESTKAIEFVEFSDQLVNQTLAGSKESQIDLSEKIGKLVLKGALEIESCLSKVKEGIPSLAVENMTEVHECFKCPICLYIVRDPTECNHCDHPYCTACVKGLKKCPLCRRS